MIRQTHSAGRSSECPPIFFRWVVRGLLALWLAAMPLALTFAGPVPAAATKPVSAGYRLAGVMLVGNDRIGFLEVPAGGQVLVRVGTTVDGGKVTRFDDQELRIAFPTRTVVLALEGGTDKPIAGATLGVVTSQEDNGHIMVRQVDPERMTAAFETTAPAKSPAGATVKRTDAQAEAGRRFAAVINLPPNARVVAVNEKPVVSADAAITELEKALANNQHSTLTLASAPGQPPGRVYVSPQRD